jgi:hypothetical protein
MATLKSAIHEAHKRYKSDQKWFSMWVTKTCSSLGIAPTPTSRPRPQLPTRTYSDAKQVASETSSEPTFPELEKMADSIAVYTKLCGKAPEGIRDALTILSALLSGRRECKTLWRIENSTDINGLSESDITHQKAIASLVRIQKALADALPATLPDQPPASKRKSPPDEKPVSSKQRGNQSVKSAHTTSTAPVPDYDLAVLRSLQALAPIRKSVRAKWNEFQSLGVSLYSATQFTRHAFALSLEVMAELNATCTESKLLFECFVRLCEHLEEPAAESDCKELCYSHASRILALLHEYVGLVQSESEDASAQEEVIRRCNEYHPLAYHLCLMAGHLPERAKEHSQGVSLYERTDPLLLTFVELCNTGEVTLEAVVAVQLYLELYEAIEMPNHRHYETLVTMSRVMNKSLAAFDSAAKGLETQPPSNEPRPQPGKTCRRVAKEVTTLSQVASTTVNENSSPEDILCFMLSCFPLLCGSVYASLVDNYYLDGIQMTQCESRVTAVVHLYRATETSGRSQRWKQLEDFLVLQGNESLGLKDVGNGGFDPQDAAVELSIALGLSRADFDNNNALDEDSVMRRLQLPHFPNPGALALPSNRHSLLKLELEVAGQDGCATTTSHSHSRHVLESLAHETLRDPQMAAAHPEIHDSLNRDERLSPVQLLQILSASPTAETKHLNMNYHNLTRSCWRLLDMFKTIHDRELQTNRGFFWRCDEDHKFNIADEILWDAASLAAMARKEPVYLEMSIATLSNLVPAFDEWAK